MDTETNDYNLRAREYDPATGRFLGTDPVAAATTDPYTSTYACVEDRPGVLIDPSGQVGIPFVDLPTAVNPGKKGFWMKGNVFSKTADALPVASTVKDLSGAAGALAGGDKTTAALLFGQGAVGIVPGARQGLTVTKFAAKNVVKRAGPALADAEKTIGIIYKRTDTTGSLKPSSAGAAARGRTNAGRPTTSGLTRRPASRFVRLTRRHRDRTSAKRSNG